MIYILSGWTTAKVGNAAAWLKKLTDYVIFEKEDAGAAHTLEHVLS